MNPSYSHRLSASLLIRSHVSTCLVWSLQSECTVLYNNYFCYDTLPPGSFASHAHPAAIGLARHSLPSLQTFGNSQEVTEATERVGSMYSYQSTSQQQQYSAPPVGGGQYAQPPYGQQPVNQSYAGASPYASTSGYAGQGQPYGQQPPPSTPLYGVEVPYGGYSQAGPSHAPAPGYGGPSSHSGYGGSPPPAPGPSHYPPQQQHHYQGGGYSSPPPPASAPYAQAPPPQHQQQQQPAGPSLPYNIGTDQNVFRGYFSHELKQLTFNSKPIINGLTILAHEHATRMAPIVCQCLEEHIRQVRIAFVYALSSVPFSLCRASTDSNAKMSTPRRVVACRSLAESRTV